MGFRDQFPDYERFDDSTYYTNSVPDGLSSALAGILLRYAGKEGIPLKSVVNDLRSFIPEGPTANWGWDWLTSDLEDALRSLTNGKFHRFMDALEKVAGEIASRAESVVIAELNELFEDHEFGYRLEAAWNGEYRWLLRQETPFVTEALDQATSVVQDICAQALGHLQQAKANLDIGTLRARKDAVRDSLSAMESMLKELTRVPDLRDAVKELRTTGRYGPDIIVKDGLTMWDRLHDLHPDIRHGDPNETDLSHEEALYWIDRINQYITYLARRKAVLGL